MALSASLSSSPSRLKNLSTNRSLCKPGLVVGYFEIILSGAEYLRLLYYHYLTRFVADLESLKCWSTAKSSVQPE